MRLVWDEGKFANFAVMKSLLGIMLSSIVGLTPLCLPEDLPEGKFDAVYGLGSMDGGVVTLYPVHRVRAGIPCVVATDMNLDSLISVDGLVSSEVPDPVPLLWDMEMAQGNYANHSWTITDEEGNETDASECRFEIVDPKEADLHVNIENSRVHAFLENADYENNLTSIVAQYVSPTSYRLDLPRAVAIPLPVDARGSLRVELSENPDMTNAYKLCPPTDDDVCLFRNLLPQHTYYYDIYDDDTRVGHGKVATEGFLRMIDVPSICNVRDLGGWLTTDNRRVKYGLLFRGVELNGRHDASRKDLNTLRSLGIGAEIDLRNDKDNEAGAGTTPLSAADDVDYVYMNSTDIYASCLFSYATLQRFNQEFSFILDNLRKGRGVYFHCVWGADRTGLLALLLEGLMGLPVHSICKEYELTSFSSSGARKLENLLDVIDYISWYEHPTFQENVTDYFVWDVGISKSQIEEFRRLMLGEPNGLSVESVTADNSQRGVSGVYALNGMKVADSFASISRQSLPKGMYIVRFSDGTSIHYFK